MPLCAHCQKPFKPLPKQTHTGCSMRCYKAMYRQKNKTRLHAAHVVWVAAHPEQIHAARVLWIAAHREQVRAQRRRARVARVGKDYEKRWYYSNIDRARARGRQHTTARRERAILSACPDDLTREMRHLLLLFRRATWSRMGPARKS